MRVLALDLGGTRLKAATIDGGVVQRAITTDAPPDGSRVSIEAAVRAAATDLGPFDAAGLCAPGLIDEHGVVVSLPGKHAGLEGMNLRTMLGEVLGTKAVVTNDAIAYATGEAIAGAGRNSRRVVVMTIGTGVGVTVIEHGAPISAGTVGGGILGGFIPISERTDGPTDSIGRPDTIEALCAAERIAQACGTDTVEQAYEVRTGLEVYREHLVRALVALASAHAPEVIVLGGGPMTPDNPITPGLETAVNARMFGSYRVRLAVAELGDAAALVGLAHLVETA